MATWRCARRATTAATRPTRLATYSASQSRPARSSTTRTVLFYTSTVAPNYPLTVDASMSNLNATIASAIIGMNAAPTPTPTNPGVQIFVSQHYLDFPRLWAGFWGMELLEPADDNDKLSGGRCGLRPLETHQRECGLLHRARLQQTGSFVYRFYQSSLGQPSYAEFASDRAHVVDGSNLEPASNRLRMRGCKERSSRSGTPQIWTVFNSLMHCCRQCSGVQVWTFP